MGARAIPLRNFIARTREGAKFGYGNEAALCVQDSVLFLKMGGIVVYSILNIYLYGISVFSLFTLRI